MNKKEMINAAVAEAINQAAKHYKTSPELVKYAIKSGNKKLRSYVAIIAGGAITSINK